MEALAISLMSLGFLGLLVSIIVLIVQAIRKKKKKPWLLTLAAFFILFIVGGVMSPRTEKDVEKQKPVTTTISPSEQKIQKPTVKQEKPTQTSISYSRKEVYDFVVNYPIYGEEAKELGYTIGSTTDLLVGILRSQGQKVDVVEGNAEPTGEKGIWRVSYVVVADGKRDKVIYVADMNKKTVEPDNQIAMDLFYGE